MLLEHLFTTKEKIEALKRWGYKVKLEDIEVEEPAYHNDIETISLKVYQVYDFGGTKIDYNFQNVLNRQTSQVDEIFYRRLKKELATLMNMVA